METDRYEKGTARLAEVDGTGGKNVVESLKDIAPDLGRYIIEFAFGDIYRREGLNLQERDEPLSKNRTVESSQNRRFSKNFVRFLFQLNSRYAAVQLEKKVCLNSSGERYPRAE